MRPMCTTHNPGTPVLNWKAERALLRMETGTGIQNADLRRQSPSQLTGRGQVPQT